MDHYFEANEIKSNDEMLRDRLGCGVNEDRIQRLSLAEPTLDLKRTLEIADGMETAAKNVGDLKGEMPNTLNERW